MINLAAISVTELIPKIPLTPDAMSFLKPDMSLADALKVMKKKGFAHESVPMLSATMPDRERVLWATRAAGNATPQPSSAEAAALKAAEAWAATPTPDLAEAAHAAAAEAGHGGAAGWAAQSAAWADPAVAGDMPGLSKHAADGALQLAMASGMGPLPTPVAEELTTLAIGAGAVGAIGAAGLASGAGGDGPDSRASVDSDAPPSPQGQRPKSATDESPPPSKKDRNKMSKAAEPILQLGEEIAKGAVPW